MANLFDLQVLIHAKVKRGGYNGFEAMVGQCPVCRDAGKDRKRVHILAWEADGFLHFTCRDTCGHTEEEILSALNWTQEDRRVVPFGDPVPAARRPLVQAAPKKKYEGPFIEPDLSTKPKDDGQISEYKNAKGRVALLKKKKWDWCQPVYSKDGELLAACWKKDFPQWCPDPLPGKAKPTPRDVGPRILYRMPELIQALDLGLVIHVCEGEKACDRFPEGSFATCQNFGAGNAENWTEHHTKLLKRARLVRVVRDNDEVGERYARYVAASLAAEGIPVEVVDAATGDPKDDAYDHFEAGFGLEDFVPRPDLLPSTDPLERLRSDGLTVFGKDFVAPELEWLIDDYMLVGRITLLDGKKGTTKSTMCLQWAASFSRGVHPFKVQKVGWEKRPVPLACGPIKTLYIHRGEDPSSQLEKVYRANGGVDGSLVFLDDVLLKLDDAGLERIRGYIVRHGFRYVVLDNLIYYLSGVCKNIYDPDQVAPKMLALSRIASDTGAAFHCHRHMKKGSGGKAAEGADISEDGLGSVIIASIARGQHVIQVSKDKPGVYILTCERGTIESAPGDPIGWRKFELELEYLDRVDDPRDKTSAADKLNQRSKARELLLNNLNCSFSTLSKDLERVALDLGVSPETLKRAKSDLGVVTKKKPGVADGKFYCRIPDEYEGEGFDPWQF